MFSIRNYKFHRHAKDRYGISTIPGYNTKMYVLDGCYEIYDANLNSAYVTIGVVSHAKCGECLREIIVMEYGSGCDFKSHHAMNPDAMRCVVGCFIHPKDDSEFNSLFFNDEIVEIDGHLYLKSIHESGNPNTVGNINSSLIYNIVHEHRDRMLNMLLWDRNPEAIKSENDAKLVFEAINNMKSAKSSLSYFIDAKKGIINAIAKTKNDRIEHQKELDYYLESEADALNELQEKFGIEL